MNARTATRRLTTFSRGPRGDHPSPSKQLTPVRTAYTALACVIVFFTFHLYSILGGSFGVGGEGYVGARSSGRRRIVEAWP